MRLLFLAALAAALLAALRLRRDANVWRDFYADGGAERLGVAIDRMDRQGLVVEYPSGPRLHVEGRHADGCSWCDTVDDLRRGGVL